jgi:hypothetical protein
MNLMSATQIFGVEKKGKSGFEGSTSSDLPVKVKGKKMRRNLRGIPGFNEGRWTEDEHKKFVKSCLIHGNNWKRVNFLFFINLIFKIGSKGRQNEKFSSD